MCLPNLIEYKQIDKSNPIIGYRKWKNIINPESLILKSEYIDYEWSKLEGPHEVREINSGIYAYNNNYNYYYNNYYNNYNNYNYYNNYNNYNYYYNNYYNNYNNYYNNYYYNLQGIINQWGKVAIHKIGQRSEYANIKTLFAIRESDTKGPETFLTWVRKFNILINNIAEQYDCNVIYWQDFNESTISNQ
jgi:hypothetical protein